MLEVTTSLKPNPCMFKCETKCSFLHFEVEKNPFHILFITFYILFITFNCKQEYVKY